MSRRDLFPLSKRRLRDDEKFRALTPSEKWHFIDVQLFLDDQEKPGVSRWELGRIARSLYCSIDVLRSLIAAEVLHGAAAGEVCEPFIHKDREGQEHQLIPAQPGPIWYSPAIVREEHLRQVASKSGRKGGGNPQLREALDTFKGAPKGGVKGRKRAPRPLPHLSPETPLLLPPPTPGNTGGCATAAGSPGEAEIAKPQAAERRRRKDRILSSEQDAIRKEFGDWWISAEYPRRHGGEVYQFEGGRDAAAVLKILRHPFIKWDLAEAKKLASYFFDQPEMYGGHQLHRLGMNPGYHVRKMRERAQMGASHVLRVNKPTAAERGQYEQPARSLPEYGKRSVAG